MHYIAADPGYHQLPQEEPQPPLTRAASSASLRDSSEWPVEAARVSGCVAGFSFLLERRAGASGASESSRCFDLSLTGVWIPSWVGELEPCRITRRRLGLGVSYTQHTSARLPKHANKRCCLLGSVHHHRSFQRGAVLRAAMGTPSRAVPLMGVL